MTRGTVAIVGAGPYGLSTAAFLRRAGIEIQVFGEVMGFWHTMPRGSFLRSYRRATNIADPDGELTLPAFERSTARKPSAPIPLATFVEYGHWYQQTAAVDVDPRRVVHLARNARGFELEVEGSDRVAARAVVVAAGIHSFAWKPAVFDGIDSDLVSHSSEHSNYGEFGDRRVAVVGGGQSAMEAAAFLSASGADPELIARRSALRYLRGERMSAGGGRLSSILYPEWGVGPPVVNWLMGRPSMFRRVPRMLSDPLAGRAIRPAGASWLQPLLDGVRTTLGRKVTAAVANGSGLRLHLDDGSNRTVDHVILGTGYRVDLARYAFIARDLLSNVQTIGSYPRVSRDFESSVPSLYFVGAPAAASAGPGMRFVSHTGFTAKAITKHLTGEPWTTPTFRRRPGGR